MPVNSSAGSFLVSDGVVTRNTDTVMWKKSILIHSSMEWIGKI